MNRRIRSGWSKFLCNALVSPSAREITISLLAFVEAKRWQNLLRERGRRMRVDHFIEFHVFNSRRSRRARTVCENAKVTEPIRSESEVLAHPGDAHAAAAACPPYHRPEHWTSLKQVVLQILLAIEPFDRR